MIYRIATPPANGKGLVGVYPEWPTKEADGESQDLKILEQQQDFSLLFCRNYSGQFVRRIEKRLLQYGRFVDIVCGWEPERLRLLFLSFNREVEAVQLSAMHFNTFDLIARARRECVDVPQEKKHDIFFAVSQRPDNLKQADLLAGILAKIRRPVNVVGFGRLEDPLLSRIRENKNIHFSWQGKAAVTDPVQRWDFLTRLARSRCLLVTSRSEGYSRLIGEALLLGVPVLLNGEILCENWIHLNSENCRMFTAGTFEICLDDMLSREWDFIPPTYQEGNRVLKSFFEDFMRRRGLPMPETWYPLKYGALTDQPVSLDSLE